MFWDLRLIDDSRHAVPIFPGKHMTPTTTTNDFFLVIGIPPITWCSTFSDCDSLLLTGAGLLLVTGAHSYLAGHQLIIRWATVTIGSRKWWFLLISGWPGTETNRLGLKWSWMDSQSYHYCDELIENRKYLHWCSSPCQYPAHLHKSLLPRMNTHNTQTLRWIIRDTGFQWAQIL